MIEEGEEYCSRCGQPVKRRQTAAKGELGRPPAGEPSKISKSEEDLRKENQKLRIRWVIMTVVALTAVVFVALPWLTAIVESSPNPGEYGLTFGSSALAFATGFQSYYGYTVHIEPVLIYWMVIMPAVVLLVISVIGIVTPKYTAGLAVYTFVLDVVLGTGIFLIYTLDLQYRLGSLSSSGYTFFRTLGWGFFGEIATLIVATILAVWLIASRARGRTRD